MKNLTFRLKIQKSILKEEEDKTIEWDIFYKGKKPTIHEKKYIKDEILSDLFKYTRHNIDAEGYNNFDMSDMIKYSFSITSEKGILKEDILEDNTYYLDRDYDNKKMLILPISCYHKVLSLKDIDKIKEILVEYEENFDYELSIKYDIETISLNEARYLHNKLMLSVLCEDNFI